MQYSHLGFGLGLRSTHFEEILSAKPPLDFFEVLTENFLVPGGRAHYYLEQIAQHYPLVFHGVSLSVGSTDDLDFKYLKQLKHLAERYDVRWVSDHLCWTSVEKQHLHDLLPLPLTEACLAHVVDRVNQIQDFLGRRLVLENIASYLSFQEAEMPEWDFIKRLIQKTGCLLLLDINNLYINAHNLHFDPIIYLESLPKNSVQQIHLAGHDDSTGILLDTHDRDIISSVWGLYCQAIQQFGIVSTSIERDANIPSLSELMLELEQAQTLAEQTHSLHELS